MNSIVETVNLFLEKYGIKQSKGKVLLGFSGGFDSLCLLNILKELEIPVIAIHLNHNWRGEESKKDENFCKEFCCENNLEFYSETLSSDIPKTETAAREARYEFYEKCSMKFTAECVLTAHNADDNAETVLYRIIKGTGVSGLSAIQEKRDIFYRPLLNVSRTEIEAYCAEKGLSPNIDSSNENTKYKRNLIRQKILPLCENINPKCKDSLNSLSEIAQEENEILIDYLNQLKLGVGNSTQKFLEISDALQNRLIYDIFTENNLDYDRAKIIQARNFIKENVHSKSGKKCSLTTNLFLFVNKEYFEIITNCTNNFEEIPIIKEGSYEIGNYIFSIEKTDNIPQNFPKDEDFCAYVNLAGLELTLRKRNDGDLITPLGSNGSQKLKKYLNSKKIPNHKKEELILLCKGNQVFWAAGIGINDKIKVETKATHVLKLTKKDG